MVPEMVVADKISAFKNTGIVPKTATIIMVILPNETDFPKFKSTANNFEKDEKVESKVEAAEVIIIKLITNKITTPKALPTSTAACPCIPCDCAYTPMMLKSTIQIAPKTLAHKKLLLVIFGEEIKPLSVKTGS